MPKASDFSAIYGIRHIGAEVTLLYGIGDIVLETCDINGFNIECHEGGTVLVAFRVQARPTGDQLARISMLLGHKVEVTITPPEAQEGLLEAA